MLRMKNKKITKLPVPMPLNEQELNLASTHIPGQAVHKAQRCSMAQSKTCPPTSDKTEKDHVIHL